MGGKCPTVILANFQKNSGIKKPTPGAMSFTHRSGSALNLNIHIHALYLDGTYSRVDGKPKFHRAKAITDQQVESLLAKISSKIMKLLKKKGMG